MAPALIIIASFSIHSAWGAKIGAALKLHTDTQALERKDLSPYVRVFIRGQNLHLLNSTLEQEGILLEGSDELAYASMTPAQIERIQDFENIEHIEKTPHLVPLLDQSIQAIGADFVHTGNRVTQARQGEGVLVGLIDTGIDFTHPAFVKEDGTPRVIALWDQDLFGTPPPGKTHGHYCSFDDIKRKRCISKDTIGHGTHVAGIMASHQYPHLGLAPKSDIIAVKSNQFDDVVGAVSWMFEMADKLKRPIVVNLSIGGHIGAHDGQSDIEKALEQLQGPGKIIVTAAGNDGNNNIHLSTLLLNQEQRTECILPPAGLPIKTTIDLWEKNYASVQFNIELYDSKGRFLHRVPLLANKQEAILDGFNYGQIYYATEDTQDNQKTHVMIVIDRSFADTSKDEEVRWFLSFKGRGSFDAWMSVDDARYGTAQFASRLDPQDSIDINHFIAGDSNSTLTIPGTAKKLITVGSFTTKNNWTNSKGKSFEVQSAAISYVSNFSSLGPTADKDYTGEKPDLIAPGQLIVAPRSSFTQEVPSSLVVGSNLSVMQGTSMAAPHVSGTVALMLEARPNMTPEQVKDTLIGGTEFNADTDGPRPNPHVGHGKLSTLRTLQKTEMFTESPKGCNASVGLLPSATQDLSALLIVFLYAYHQRRKPKQKIGN